MATRAADPVAMGAAAMKPQTGMAITVTTPMGPRRISTSNRKTILATLPFCAGYPARRRPPTALSGLSSSRASSTRSNPVTTRLLHISARTMPSSSGEERRRIHHIRMATLMVEWREHSLQTCHTHSTTLWLKESSCRSRSSTQTDMAQH